MNDIYRGNKAITVRELTKFLASFADEAEVTFYVAPDLSSSFYHVDALETGENQGPWIDLTPR